LLELAIALKSPSLAGHSKQLSHLAHSVSVVGLYLDTTPNKA